MLSLFRKWFGAPPNIKTLLQQGALLVDVRNRYAYQAEPLEELSERLAEIKTHRKPVIVVCRSGSRSVLAKRLLRHAGVKAYNGGWWRSLKYQYGLK